MSALWSCGSPTPTATARCVGWHNALALGLIDIEEFDERSSQVSQARTHGELDALVGDLPGPGAIVTSATDRVELRGWAGLAQAPR